MVFNMSTKLDKQLAENNAKIEQFTSRIEKLAEKREGLIQRLKALREARKDDLVNGVNVDNLTKEINHITSQEQLFDDELQGLQEAIAGLQGKSNEIMAAIHTEQQDALNGKCIELARTLNSKFSELAPLVKQYNEMIRQSAGKNAGRNIYFGDRHPGEEAEVFLKLPVIFIKGELDANPAYIGWPDRPDHDYLKTYNK